MKKLDNETMSEITGGAISRAALAAAAAFGIFIVGVIDGILRPLPCNR